jgi:hypothetical protein
VTGSLLSDIDAPGKVVTDLLPVDGVAMESDKLLRVTLLLMLVAAIVTVGSFWLRGSEETPTPALPAGPSKDVPATSTSSAPIVASTSANVEPTCTKTLLSQEPILVRNGITLFMAHSEGEAGVRLPQRCQPAQLESLFALSATGVQRLTTDPSIVNPTAPWGCMQQIPAVGMRATQTIEQDDMPVASGAQVPTVLQWTPAVPADATVQCAAPRLDFQSEEQRLFEITDSTSRWLVEAWRPAPDPLETPQDAGARPIPRVFVVSSVSREGECTTQGSAESSGSGPPTGNAGQYRRIYGVLKAKDSTGEKSWMILESGNDDARAVVAMPLDPGKAQLQLRQQDAWFYSGC